MDFVKRVLIIDDEANMTEWLSEVVNSAGYMAFTTMSPTMALLAAAEEKPCAIVCDINMPGLTGFHMLRLLKDHSATAEIPVILMSENGVAIAPEAAAVLVKPFQAEELLAVLELNSRVMEIPEDTESNASTG